MGVSWLASACIRDPGQTLRSPFWSRVWIRFGKEVLSSTLQLINYVWSVNSWTVEAQMWLETRTLASRRGGPNESQGVCSGNQRTLDFHMGAPLLVNGARARIKSMGEQRQLPRQVPRAAGNAAGGAEQSLPNGAQGCWKMLRTIHWPKRLHKYRQLFAKTPTIICKNADNYLQKL